MSSEREYTTPLRLSPSHNISSQAVLRQSHDRPPSREATGDHIFRGTEEAIHPEREREREAAFFHNPYTRRHRVWRAHPVRDERDTAGVGLEYLGECSRRVMRPRCGVLRMSFLRGMRRRKGDTSMSSCDTYALVSRYLRVLPRFFDVVQRYQTKQRDSKSDDTSTLT